MKIQGIIKDSIVDGPGVRFTIFAQGCPHECKGCHNPETWDPRKGYYISPEEVFQQIKNEKYIRGVTFSGGEPYEQWIEFLILAALIKNNTNLDIWCYTGYEYNIIKNNPLSNMVDYIVDGAFVQDLYDPNLSYRGSSNQQIYDIKLDKVVDFNC